MKATYFSGVYKWNMREYRTEQFTAIVEQISPNKFKVVDVLDISKPKSKRQDFNTAQVARNEIGKIKLRSSLEFIEE